MLREADLLSTERTMHDAVEELARRGQALAPEDRSRLVDMLLVSLHEGPVEQIEAAWDDEVERRLAAYDRGEVQAIDGEDVLAQARTLARR
jgi:putative addiction module component (TIGR02574 family)